ncbi:MAG: FtsX-like permease family protein [Bacteroidota bacterium]
MLKNYFKTAWRNISANKLFTVLNIAGLAIGLCVSIILFAYVSNELSFDRMYQNAKNIYHVNMQTSEKYDFKQWAELPNAVGPALMQDIPQVKYTTRLLKADYGAVVSLKTDDKNFVEKSLYLADSSVLSMFDIRFIEGNVHTAFDQPKSIILSQAAKERMFGNTPAFGKIIYVNNRDTLHVSGVYKDLPENSTIDCDMIANIMDSWMGKNVSWSNASFETYCLLQPNANIDEVQKQASALIDKNVPKENQYYTKFLFQPLTDIHLYSADLREGYSSRLGNIRNVKALLFLSLLVLLIACINYMNLATARSQKRAKGVGVNKVLGASLRQMLLYFYAETALLAFISVVVGYALAFLTIPLFGNISGIELGFSALYTTPIVLSLLAVWLAVTFIAGSYPAFSISRISPLTLINKSKQKHSLADFVRKGLVVFQFASSIILIISVIVILQQMKYIRNKDLGYNPRGVVSLSIKSAQNKKQVVSAVNELKQLANVESVATAQSIPGDVESGRSIRKTITEKEGLPVKTCRTDGSITETMQLTLLAGTGLPKNVAETDSTCYMLINETVASYLGFASPKDAIGKYVPSEFSDRSLIMGVVKNFNYKSLKDEIGGYIYYEMNGAPESIRTLLVRYNTQNPAQLLGQIQDIFKTNLPNSAFDYQFLDTHIQHLYASEQHTASAATVFSLLAIFIACLGLFGLAAFTAEQRTKEIGIRKVLGASIPVIAGLLTRDFLKLIVLAILIASPIAWWLMSKWLLGFVYRIQIEWWVFVIAGASAVVIALLTIGFQAIKSARANPVKSLRTE